MNIIKKALDSCELPNLLIFGYDLYTIRSNFLKILSEVYKIDEPIILNHKKLTYYKTNIYYEFNMSNINYDNFYEILLEIVTTKNYFGNISLKLIILYNFNNIKSNIQNSLRVFIEKYRKTSVFILLTSKYNSIQEPLKSRCLNIRLSLMNRKEKIKLVLNKERYELTPQYFDKLYSIHNDVITLKYSKLDSNNVIDFKNPEEIIKDCIIQICLMENYSKTIHNKIREISYHILKYNVNFNEILYKILDEIFNMNKLDKFKIKVLKLLVDMEYNFKRTYRKIITIESLFIQLYELFHLKFIDIMSK